MPKLQQYTTASSMNTYKHFLILCLALLFPIGLWLLVEGYELPSIFFLIMGYVPVAQFLADSYYDSRKNETTEKPS